jgi:hypothetical protein
MVLSPIAFADDPRLFSAEKPRDVQAVVPEFADETFAGPILPRLPRLAIRRANALGGQPRVDRLSDAFWSIVTAQRAGHAMDVDEALEHGNHSPRVDPMADLGRETHPRIPIDDRQACEGFPIRTAVVHDIIGPHVMRPCGLRGPRRGWTSSPAAACVQVEAALSPKARASLMVHMFPLPPQECPDAAVPLAWMLLGQALHRRLQLGILERPLWYIPQHRA